MLKQKKEDALMHLQRITRKVPPRVENSYIQKGKAKDRNYLYLRSDHSKSRLMANPKLRRSVKEEIDRDQRELFDLASRVGFIDSKATIGCNFGTIQHDLGDYCGIEEDCMSEELDERKLQQQISEESDDNDRKNQMQMLA